LSTVYGIVSTCGGWIHVKSKPRGGTTFQIYLPRVEVSAAERGHDSQHAAQVLRGNETVLVVEDQSHVRRLTCAILQEYGYETLEAFNGEEALQLAATHNGPLNLVLTDLIMPGMNGLELANRLKEIRRTPVIFMSGYSGSIERRPGLGVAYIQKPITPEGLVTKVRESLGHNRPLGADPTNNGNWRVSTNGGPRSKSLTPVRH